MFEYLVPSRGHRFHAGLGYTALLEEACHGRRPFSVAAPILVCTVSNPLQLQPEQMLSAVRPSSVGLSQQQKSNGYMYRDRQGRRGFQRLRKKDVCALQCTRDRMCQTGRGCSHLTWGLRGTPGSGDGMSGGDEHCGFRHAFVRFASGIHLNFTQSVSTGFG